MKRGDSINVNVAIKLLNTLERYSKLLERLYQMDKKKTLESLRQELGVTPPLGRSKGIPTYLMHLAFRLNEKEATAFIKAAQKARVSESLYGRVAIMEKVEREA